MYVCVFSFVCVCVCVYVCVHARARACMCACMHARRVRVLRLSVCGIQNKISLEKKLIVTDFLRCSLSLYVCSH